MVAYRPIDWIEWLPGDLYRVGDDGSVWRWYAGSKSNPKRNPPRWRILKPKTRRSVPSVHLSHKRRNVSVFVPYLVLRAFVGPRPFGHIAFHFPDRNTLNNRLSNLRWAPRGTQNFDKDTEPNMSPAFLPGPHNVGEDNPTAKLTWARVRAIRKMGRLGLKPREIADRFRISRRQVYSILGNKSWRDTG